VIALVDVAAAATSIVDANITDRRISVPNGMAPKGQIITLSTDHPATMDKGQLLYETDTGRTAIYDGSEVQEYATFRSTTGSANYGGSTSRTTVATLTIPPGTWILQASAYLDWSIASAGRTATFEIYDATADAVQQTVVETLDVTAGKKSVSITDAQTYTTTSAVRFSVTGSTTGGTTLVQSAKFVAWSVN